MKTIRKHGPGLFPVSGTWVLFPLLILVLFGCIPAFAQDVVPDVDLRIVGMLSLHPPLPDEGDDVQIGILVENRGGKNARDVPVYFYEDDVYFDKVTLDIPAEDTVYVETMWIADHGDSYISVAVDPAGGFNEDKKDNATGVWMTVR